MILFILLLLFSSCEPTTTPKAKTQILGRSGAPIYQAEVPTHWEEMRSQENLSDTTVPLVTYKVGLVQVVVHNFPSTTFESRIPPQAQVERWKRQLGAAQVKEATFHNGGFGGIRLEAYGREKGAIAYAMQLTPMLYRKVDQPEIRADYTIKATGPNGELKRQKQDIDSFAESFELIEPL